MTLAGWDLPYGLPDYQSDGEHNGHYRGVCDIVVDWIGARTFTLAVGDFALCKDGQDRILEDDPDRNPPNAHTLTITGVAVDRIDVISGAAPISDGPNTPSKTDICAAIKAVGYVVLVARLTGGASLDDLPSGCTVNWTAGEPYAADPTNSLMRQVSRESFVKYTLLSSAAVTQAQPC